jgi:hypothetical protein
MLTTLKITRKIYKNDSSSNVRVGSDDNVSSGSSSVLADQDLTSEAFLAQQWRDRLTIQEKHHLTLPNVVPVLNAATEDLRRATLQGVIAVRETLDFINENRFGFFRSELPPTHDQKLDSAIDALRQSLQEFKVSKRLEILQPYLDNLGVDATHYANLPSLHVTHVFSATFVIVSEALLALMEYVEYLLSKRRRSRLWAPKSLRDMARALSSNDIEEEEKIAEEDQEEVGKDDYFGYRGI